MNGLSPENMALLREIYDAPDHRMMYRQGDEGYRRRISALRSAGLVRLLHIGLLGDGATSYVCVLPAGEDALAEETREAEARTQQQREAADQKQVEDKRRRKDARRQWIQWSVDAFIALFSLFLGAYLAGQTTFMDWFLCIFR